MMGKTSKRPGRAARDVHATIKAQAQAARSAPRFAARDADETPELAALLTSARARIELALHAAMPASFDHEGRTYFLRTGAALMIKVFEAPGASEPLVHGAVFSSAEFGHAPGH